MSTPRVLKESAEMKHRMVIDEYFLNGYSREDAYMKVYKTTNRVVAASQCVNIFARENIKDYIKFKQNKLTKKIETKTLINKEYVINKMIDILEESSKETHLYKHAIAAATVINKMLGYNEAEKTDITVSQVQWNETKTYLGEFQPTKTIEIEAVKDETID